MSDKQTQNQWVSGINAGTGIGGVYATGMTQIAGGEAEQAGYDFNAAAVMQQTKEEAQASELKFTALSGRERSLYAKAGVSVSSGSPLLIAMHTAAQAQQEVSRVETTGKTKAKLLQYYGELANWSGKVAGMTSFLTGLSKVSNTWAGAQ